MDDTITKSLELFKIDEQHNLDDTTKITVIAEARLSQETMAKANRILSQKVVTIINKRGQAADLRDYARMAERECRQLEQDSVSLNKESDEYKQRVAAWEAKNRFAKENRIVANRLDKEASRMEDGFNGEEFEKALAHKKSVCGIKRQEAERLKYCAIKAEEDYYRLCKQAADMPPRLSERRAYIEASAMAKEQAAIAAGTAAYRLDVEADRIEEQTLKAKDPKAKTLMHKVKAETKCVVTEEIGAKTKTQEVTVEAKPKAIEEARPVQVTNPSDARKERADNKTAVTRKEREEEDKTMTLIEYEKIKEEKKKALKAKFCVAEEDGGRMGKEEGEGTKKKQGSAGKNRDTEFDCKRNGGRTKKVNAQEVLNINKKSYYTRPPRQYNGDHGDRNGGGGGGGYTRQSYRRNFGDQRSASAAPSRSAAPPANNSRDFPPLEQN